MEIPRLVRKFKKRLFIAFLIIAVGMLYFAGEYLFENYRTYRDLRSVEPVSYTHLTLPTKA